MAEKFILQLTPADWNKLNMEAKEKGYESFRAFVPSILEELKGDSRFSEDATCEDKRIRNNFEIPEDLQRFYINVACKNSSTISAAIFRYVILPILIK